MNTGKSAPMLDPAGVVGMFGYFFVDSRNSLRGMVENTPAQPLSAPEYRPGEVFNTPAVGVRRR